MIANWQLLLLFPLVDVLSRLNQCSVRESIPTLADLLVAQALPLVCATRLSMFGAPLVCLMQAYNFYVLKFDPKWVKEHLTVSTITAEGIPYGHAQNCMQSLDLSSRL